MQIKIGLSLVSFWSLCITMTGIACTSFLQYRTILLTGSPHYAIHRPYIDHEHVTILTTNTSIDKRSSLQGNEVSSESAAVPVNHVASSGRSTQANSSRSLANELLENFGIAQYLVYRNNTPTHDSITKLPLVMLVHHREFFVGCHTLERYFNPKWETIVVVEEDFADQYGLKQLADSASSPAIHLALLRADDMSGEWLGRQVALHILNYEHDLEKKPVPPMILSTQCDIHPLPSVHSLYKPYEATVERMMHLFLEEDRLNQEAKQKTNVNEYNHMWEASPLDTTLCKPIFGNTHRPLLALNTAMVETLPSTETLERSRFHGSEVGLASKWSDVHLRSTHDSKSWVSDVSTFVEDHFILYNTTLLTRIVRDLARVHATVSAGVKAIPQLLCKNGWKAIRLNDEIMYIDFAKPQHKSIGGEGRKSVQLFDPAKYGSVSFDWLLHQSIRKLGQVNSPLECLREYMGLRIYANLDVKIACTVAASHFQSDHIPKAVWYKKVGQYEGLLGAIMKLHGYEPIGTNEEFLSFFQVPTVHKVHHNKLVARLTEGTDGIISGSLRSKLHYIQVPRNSTIKRASFFAGHSLRLSWQALKTNLRDSREDAERACSLLRSSASTNETFAPFNKEQISVAFGTLRSLCSIDFDWHVHEPLTGRLGRV